MAFDLFLTISGLCLLVRREEELLVLLPDTRDHPADHQHHAVLGSHARYQPDEAGVVNGFVEHRLAPQILSFDDFDTNHVLTANLNAYGIAHIEDQEVEGLRPESSYLQFVLSDGAPCPLNLCAHEKGGQWRYKDEIRSLATALHWRIREVSSEVDGREGLGMKIVAPFGSYVVKLRPVNGQLRMYLFHTREDELPSKNPPIPTHLVKGNEAPHFRCYERLFSEADLTIPTFEADEDEADTIDDPGLVATAVRPARPHVPVFKDHIGRRYSCLLASFDETE